MRQSGAGALPGSALAPDIRGRRLAITVGGIGALALTAVHVGLSRLPLQQATRLAPLDSLFAIALALGLLTLAGALGSRVLRYSAVVWHNTAERVVFSIAVGLGLISYAVMALAFCHLLYAPLLVSVATLGGVLLRSELRQIAAFTRGNFLLVPRATIWRVAPVPLIAGGGALFLVLLLPVALLPPFAYDALWYHLAAPRVFVQQHAYVALPAIPQANFPFTVEMLYAICLAFGSDVSPALLHLGFAVLTVLGAWSLGARFFDSRVGWLALAGLLTASDIHKLGVIADVDLALMLFEFLAVYALLVWLDEGASGWLYLAAAMAGLAMGSKYTALALLAPLGLLLLLQGGIRPRRVLVSVRPLLVFTFLALLVASPWYLKNLVVFHNPLYPFLSPPYRDPGLSLAQTTAAPTRPVALNLAALAFVPLHMLQSGSNLSLTGRSVLDYLQLPLQVYLRGDLEMYGHPSVLFLLAPLALLFDRRPVTLRLAAVALVMSMVWALGPQELRYLVPMFPLYALLSAVALFGLASRCRSRRAARLVVLLPVVALLTVTAAEDVYLVVAMQPLPVLLGLQSKDAFLRRVVTDYGALTYLAGVVQPGQRVLALGEARSYYATVPLITDGARDLATLVFVDAGSPAATAQLLRRADVAFIMVNGQDLQFQATIAPAQAQRAAAAFQQFKQQYLHVVYQGYAMRVYRVVQARPAG